MEPHLAYLDAGSGSLIVQAIVAGTAGVVVAAKMYWRRLTGVFRRKTPAEATTQTTQTTPTATTTPTAATTAPAVEQQQPAAATADKD
ncbi:hypothetical protein [Asanoa sp. NPDC050611]|uniref:hypothetical protein n=1 Tax=Asanoa sp. NPDC050611 TaxID=3157098 RepID=UPI0033C92401